MEELSLEERVKLAEGQYKTIQDMYIRLAADFDNYKKRNSTISQDKYNDGIDVVITEVMPTVDSLDRAIAYTDDEKQRQGLVQVRNEFIENMAKFGAQIYGKIGEEFDPKLYDCVATRPDEENKGKVSLVLKSGIKRNDKILKHAMCIVGE